MLDLKKVKNASLFPLVSELLEQGQEVRLTIAGNSMYPFLRHGVDSVEFAKVDFAQINKGDIVLIKREDGSYVMHRVCRKEKDHFFMVGDAQQWIEGPLYPEQLIAVVIALWRRDRRILCSDFKIRLAAMLWLKLRPYRLRIIRVYSKLKAIFKS